MGRRVSYLVLKERAAKAEKREDFKRQARIASPKPYQKAPKRFTGYYNSYLKEETIYTVSVVGANLKCLVTGTPADSDLVVADFTAAGLLMSVPASKSAVPIKGTGIKPATVRWYKGLETPVSGRTPWDTPSRKWGDKTGGINGQSHRSCPVGDLNTPFSYAGIAALLTVLLTSERKTKLLGASGQITLIPETGNTQF